MAESKIPVDLLNPGQVFACLGLMEAAEVLLCGVHGAFDWSSAQQANFRMSADGTEEPVARVMRFLEEAEVIVLAPERSPNIDGWKSSWGEPPRNNSTGDPFPYPDPQSPATLPVILKDEEGNELSIDYWGDTTSRDNVKFWAGAAGYPGAALLRDAFKMVRGKLLQFGNAPFELSHAQSSSFRFDWRRDYVPAQTGFSPNKKRGKPIRMVGFPTVEILAAIGVSHARPLRRKKLSYEYAVLGYGSNALVDIVFHRAALGARISPIPGCPFRRFAIQLDWPNQEGQDRCITQVTEETKFHGISIQ